MGSCTSSAQDPPKNATVPASSSEGRLLHTKQSLAANSRVGPTHPAAYAASTTEPSGQMSYPLGLGAGSGAGLGLGGGYSASVNMTGAGVSTEREGGAGSHGAGVGAKG